MKDGTDSIDFHFQYAISKVTPQSVICWLIFALLGGIIAYSFFRNKKLCLRSFITIPFLVFYLSFVFTITIIAREPTPNAQYQLILFWTYNAIANGQLGLMSEIFWNIILFTPIGFLLMFLFAYKNKLIISLITGLSLSLLIEISQLISHRGLFEFDDILHNLLGTFIGILVYIFVKYIKKKHQSIIE